MNDRKQQVITTAHQLFIKNGFQATSIQDILDQSKISKGTFYNYFSSKNELLMAIFTYLNHQLNKERDDLLIGQDPSDLNIFIEQMELEFDYNGKNKLFTLLEEAFFTNDPTVKQFLKAYQIKQFYWTYTRFIDIFGKSKQPYLLDCTILFTGMLQNAIHFNFISTGSGGDIQAILRYTVKRLEKWVQEIESSDEPLFKPERLYQLLPNDHRSEENFKKSLELRIGQLKKVLGDKKDDIKYYELLDFIQEELTHSSSPRVFLIKSALASLTDHKGSRWGNERQKLEHLVEDYFSEKEK